MEDEQKRTVREVLAAMQDPSERLREAAFGHERAAFNPAPSMPSDWELRAMREQLRDRHLEALQDIAAGVAELEKRQAQRHAEAMKQRAEHHAAVMEILRLLRP